MKPTTDYPKILPPMGLLIAILLAFSSHFLLPILHIVPGLWRLMGLLPVILGTIISYVAENQFHQTGTTVKPFDESRQLVVNGLYRYSRNPMYLGMVLVLLGIALLLGSLVTFVAIILFAGWIDTQFICYEEQKLSAQFGQDWLEYKASVRRWI